MKTNPTSCVNLPQEWQNRASSILTNGCVVFYTDENCKSSKQYDIFSSARLNFEHGYYSKKYKIPNYSFYGTW